MTLKRTRLQRWYDRKNGMIPKTKKKPKMTPKKRQPQLWDDPEDGMNPKMRRPQRWSDLKDGMTPDLE